MDSPDLNLLTALDVLLAEGNVTRAARRLQLSASAMSRTLARLRAVTGDPLLVRAGRRLVPSPRAMDMRDRVQTLVQEARALLRPEEAPDPSTLARTFVLRTSDGFAESFGPALIGRIMDEAPNVRLRFVRKLDKDSAGLRDGEVDLETGVVARSIGPEVRAKALFEDRYIAVMRADHRLAKQNLTPEGYADARHVLVWREGLDLGTIDKQLKAVGLTRRIVTTVDGFAAALALAAASDLIATVPERHTRGLRAGMHSVALPLASQPFTISLLWHPRMDGDPAHRWLRQCVEDACAVARVAPLVVIPARSA